MSARPVRTRRQLPIVVFCLAGAACGTSPPSFVPASMAVMTLDRAAVVAALDYWRDTVGISYVIKSDELIPRLLVRPGTDGLAVQGGGRAGPDGTDGNNALYSALAVFEPGGGQYCRGVAWQCRYLYRHEIGHALGFFGHSGITGLMQAGSDELNERERRMMMTLYSLPHGARVERDGSWRVEASGAAGQLEVQVANDIIDWHMTARGGSSFRSLESISRWELPVPVSLRERTGG